MIFNYLQSEIKVMSRCLSGILEWTTGMDFDLFSPAIEVTIYKLGYVKGGSTALKVQRTLNAVVTRITLPK